MSSSNSEILTEVDRILESRWLKESNQLRNLLRHVVEETLAGRQDGLKEYSLGLQVFHRQPDYDPRNDAIVRVQASLLRKRLAAYYENEGRESALRIDLPRGGYVPSIREVKPEPQPVQVPSEAPARRKHSAALPLRWFGSGVAAGVLLTLAGWLLFHPRPSRPPLPAPSLWGAFVNSSAESIVSYGIPLFYTGGSGIYVRDARVNVPGEEEKGVLGDVARSIGALIRPQEDVYTGIGDLVGTHQIIRWLESHGVKTSLANSHHLGHSDIAAKNLVVVSSVRFQTLLQEMNLPSHFRFDPSPGGSFLIDNPISGEQRHYLGTSGAGVDTSYAVISLWPGKRRDTRIMYLSGITTWATQGAAQYAVDPRQTGLLQERLDADPPEGPRGRKSKFFQLLLRVEGKNNLVRGVEYVTHRYLPHGG